MKSQKGKLLSALVWAVCISVGCTSMCRKSREEMNAEEVVEAYLDLAFNMEDIAQKDNLMEFTTGSLKAAIAGATDETIIAAYIKQRYKLERFSIVERRDRTPRETEITYQIHYKELPEDGKEFKDAHLITTENTVSVIKEKKRWYIREVLGNKTTIDFPITEDSQIKPP